MEFFTTDRKRQWIVIPIGALNADKCFVVTMIKPKKELVYIIKGS